MNICIKWKKLSTFNQNFCKVLYANIDILRDKIVYIGKADFCSVKERLNGKDKKGLYDYLKKNDIPKIRTIVGNIYLESDKKLSRELLIDIESLLVKRINPIGNIQSTKTRISRPGMRVFCEGFWPLVKNAFYDIG